MPKRQCFGIFFALFPACLSTYIYWVFHITSYNFWKIFRKSLLLVFFIVSFAMEF